MTAATITPSKEKFSGNRKNHKRQDGNHPIWNNKKSCRIATLHKNCWSPRVELGITQGMSRAWAWYGLYIRSTRQQCACWDLNPKPIGWTTHQLKLMGFLALFLKADYSANWVIDTRINDDTTRTVAPPSIWKIRNEKCNEYFLVFSNTPSGCLHKRNNIMQTPR